MDMYINSEMYRFCYNDKITCSLILNITLNNYYMVTGQNGSGQNCIGRNDTDKMVWTKRYNFIFCVYFNSVEFNMYLVTKSHK